MKAVRKLISGILAGVCISFGGTVYLSTENILVGAILFCLGLFVICTARLDLYTGQIGYIFQSRDVYLPLVLVGNIIGAIGVSGLVRLAGMENIIARAAVVTESKLDKSLLNLLILAALCNVCIYIAVEGYKKLDGVAKYIAIFLGVTVFIVCGFEHSVADVFYFSLAGWSIRAFIAILVIIAGNAIGGICAHNLYLLSRNTN